MSKQDKKVELLTKLTQVGHSLTLPEIVNRFPMKASDRTVRRWLTELVDEGLVQKSGSKRSSRYQATGSKDVVFSQSSLESIAYTKLGLYERKPVVYNRDWVKAYQPNETFYLDKRLRQTLHAIGGRGVNDDPAGTYARRIYNRLLIDLSFNSSRLEGNTYSLIETERLVIEGITGESKINEETVMILNHKEAIRHLVERAASVDVSYTEICTLHYLLADGLIPSQFAGKIRDHAVRVSGSTFITLEGVSQLTDQLNFVVDKASHIKDPYEQSFFLLLHLSYLQAFVDVNKRTARLSANIPLVKNNLVPLSFNSIDQSDYASAIIAVYELNDPQPLAELYAFSYQRTCMEYTATVEAIGFDRIRVKYRPMRRDLIRHIIVNQLVGGALKSHVDEYVAEELPDEVIEDFKEDLYEDLQQISAERISGLGVTLTELTQWKKLRDE